MHQVAKGQRRAIACCVTSAPVEVKPVLELILVMEERWFVGDRRRFTEVFDLPQVREGKCLCQTPARQLHFGDLNVFV